MSIQLGKFQPGDIIEGRIIRLEQTGALVDFNVEQLVHVPLLEISMNDIKTPEDALQLNEIRDFLVVGNYDGKSEFFCSNCSPETLVNSDHLRELAYYQATNLYGYSVDRKNIVLHTTILGVGGNGVSLKIQWFVCSDDRPPTVSFSIRQLEIKKAWERVRQLQAEGVIISATIFKTGSRNGLVRIEGLCGSIQTYVDKHIAVFPRMRYNTPFN